MVDFAGWYMPVQYEGIRAEHLCVRNDVGLFDVSHMGEIFVRGPKALETLQWTTTNDVSRLQPGQAHYSLLTNEQGGVVDDLIIYCINSQEYLLCVNASNIEKDFDWLRAHNRGAEIVDESAVWGQIAIQGPKALALATKVLKFDLQLPYFHFSQAPFANTSVLIARTGYTGEEGVEVFVPREATAPLWRTLLEVGQSFGVKPIGLGARDTLRLEMAYCLYGHELNDTTNPYEANLGWVIKPQAKDFVGKNPILKGKNEGLTKKLVGLKMLDKGIPRQNYRIFSAAGTEVGFITSGTHSPSLDLPIGLAYLSLDLCNEGQEIFVDIRGRHAKAVVVKLPFIQPSTKSKKS